MKLPSWTRVRTLPVVTATLVLFTAVVVLAGHFVDFEIDGDLVATATQDFGPAAGGINGLISTSPAVIMANDAPPSAVDNPAAPGIATLFFDDISSSGRVDSTIFTRGSKETSPSVPEGPPEGGVTDWKITDGSVPPNKDDISLVYTWVDDEFQNLVMAMERLNVLGDSHLDFALDHNPWAPCPNDADSLCPVRAEGDVLMAFDLSNGGAVVTTRVFLWDIPGGEDVGAAFGAGGTTGCDGSITGNGNLSKSCAGGKSGADKSGWEEIPTPANVIETVINNAEIDAGPWGSFGKGAELRTKIPRFGYFEVYIDLVALGFEPRCPVFGTASVRSRSSDSIDSELKDLAGPIDLGIDCLISGFKFNDLNADGIWQQPEEPPLPGFAINLTGAADGTTVTDENGFYEFLALIFGNYTVDEDCPAGQGWRQTFPGPLTTEAMCGENTQPVELSLGSPMATDVNFGNALLPDVHVAKSAAIGTISAGELASFSITVSNDGGGTAFGVTLDDTLPGVGIVWSENPDTPECTITGGNVLACNFGTLEPGATFTVTVEGLTSAADCGLLDNTAMVAADNEPADDQDDNTDDAEITVNCPDLRIVKTPDGGVISAGETASFGITVTNDGPGTAFDVVLDDPLPNGGLVWVENPDLGDCNITGDDLHCDIGTLLPGDSFSVTVEAETDAADCKLLENLATADASNDDPVSDPGDILVRCPDLRIVKTPDGGVISAGETASFGITVTNDGPGTAFGVTLDDPLPNGGLVWAENPDLDDCDITGDDLHCDIGTLLPGDSFTVTVDAETDAADCKLLENLATADADNSDQVSDPGDILVRCPHLRIVKTPDGAVIDAGQTASFGITVTNDGPGTAFGVTLDDPLPNGGLVWVENPDLAGCTISGDDLHCDIGTLLSGDSFSVTVEAETDVDDCKLLENLATADADNADPVSDPGDITVRCPQGKIAPTATTCEDFTSGTAGDITEIAYGIKSGLINNASPGVFFYYTQVAAPGPSFSVQIVQTNDNAAVPFFDVQNNNQVRLFDADCTTLGLGSFSAANGQTTLQINGATAGQVFVISVKYETSTVVGGSVPAPPVVHYDFATMEGGIVVDQDVDGLDLAERQ